MEFVRGCNPSRARFLASATAAATVLAPISSPAQELTALRVTAVQNADVVNRFAQVMRTATAYSNTHPVGTAPLIAAFTHLDPARVAQMKRVTCGEYLDPRDVQPAIDAAAKYKAIAHAFPAQELISPAALKPPGR